MPPTSLLLQTPLGRFEFVASVEGTQPVTVSLRSAPLRPRLPPDMAVEACHAVVLQAHSPGAIASIRFQVRRRTDDPVTSDVEAGEGLEARTWWSVHSVVTVGTEDWDALRLRLKDRIALPGDPIQHSDDGLTVELSGVPANEPLSLHFVVACNSFPEPQESSCWYAVDQRHAIVVAAVDAGPTDSSAAV